MCHLKWYKSRYVIGGRGGWRMPNQRGRYFAQLRLMTNYVELSHRMSANRHIVTRNNGTSPSKGSGGLFSQIYLSKMMYFIAL